MSGHRWGTPAFWPISERGLRLESALNRESRPAASEAKSRGDASVLRRVPLSANARIMQQTTPRGGERAVEAPSTLQSTVAGDSVLRSSERHFYLWMAGVFVLIAFGGFTPTYWGRVASGTFHGPPILHIHGALLFSWTLFYLIQTAWIASGHTPFGAGNSDP